MSFGKNLFDAAYKTVQCTVQNAYQRITTGMPLSAYELCEIPAKHLLQQPPIYVVQQQTGAFTLYLSAADKRYHVAYRFGKTGKVYSVFRAAEQSEAMLCNDRLKKHEFLLEFAEDEGVLRRLVTVMHERPHWEAVHYASHVGLLIYFDTFEGDPALQQQIKLPCEPEDLLPLHIAVKEKQQAIVTRLVSLKCDPSVVDVAGMSAIHHAAKTSAVIVKALAAHPKFINGVNNLNHAGYTPLFIAVMNGSTECVQELLDNGAVPNMRCHDRSPLQEAMSSEKGLGCISALIAAYPQSLAERDPGTGNTPLHNAKVQKSLAQLLEPAGCTFDVDPKNKEGFTPLHLQVIRGDLGCVVKLLAYGANPNIADHNGNTSLHLVVSSGDDRLLKALLVFGAMPNIQNAAGVTVRHLAATQIDQIEKKERCINCLELVGAIRCHTDTAGCTSFCAYQDQNLCAQQSNQPTDMRQASPSKTSTSKTNALQVFAQKQSLERIKELKRKKKKFVNCLSLDGGGIRGLITIQCLLALEQALGEPISEYFGWMAGTSTGGIIVLALNIGLSLRECQRIYFRLKDAVFQGFTRPYDSAVLERFYKKEFGDNKTMADIKGRNVMITTVTAEVMPVELKLLRNYRLPLSDDENQQLDFWDPCEVPIWKAARCTSAAPSFFSTVDGRYVDGGLVANNPTLDLLVDVHTVNTAWRYLQKPDNVVELGCVVSVGTGRIPDTPINSRLDIGLPDNMFDAVLKAFAIKELGALLVEQVAAIEGAPVDRARAWCHMLNVPYFRFCTRMTKEVQMDTKDDLTLINMLWETMEYLQAQQHEIEMLVQILKA